MLIDDEAYVEEGTNWIEVTMGSDFVRLYNLTLDQVQAIIDKLSSFYGSIDDMEEFYDAAAHLMEELVNAEVAM